jgi:hypothetical protein
MCGGILLETQANKNGVGPTVVISTSGTTVEATTTSTATATTTRSGIGGIISSVEGKSGGGRNVVCGGVLVDILAVFALVFPL